MPKKKGKSNAERQREYRERQKHRDEATKAVLEGIIASLDGKTSPVANSIRSAAEDVLKLFK